MAEISKIHVGLDVHKDSISVTVAEPGRSGGRLVGRVIHDVAKLIKVLGKIGAADQLHLVYEAGPTDFGLQRKLSAKGYCCEIIAPSQIPRRAGDRVKTDGRDSIELAECSRAGQLSAIWISQPEDEAIRALSRAREDAVQARTQARHQLKGFLLRHDVRYGGQTAWCGAYYRWLATLNFGADPTQTAFTEYWLAVTSADERVQRLTQSLQSCITNWRFAPVVAALQALRGVAEITAIGLVAEIGELSRFDHPRKLMGYLGLVPSEHSSGARTMRGSITKTGNAHARRLLIEAAWNYRFKAHIGKEALQRQQVLPEHIRTMAWKAQLRLTQRFAALNARGLQVNKACIFTAKVVCTYFFGSSRIPAEIRATLNKSPLYLQRR